MWRNTVIDRLMHDWLRELNEGRAPRATWPGFYGLDIYNMSGSIEAVLAYLDEHDPEAAAVARERYGCLTPWQAEPADLRPRRADPRLRRMRGGGRSRSAASCWRAARYAARTARACSARR